MNPSQQIRAAIAGAIFIVVTFVFVIMYGCDQADRANTLTTDLKSATNEVQNLRGQMVVAQTNYTYLHGQATAIEAQRDNLAAEKARLVANQANALQSVTNAFSGQIATLEQDKANLAAEKARLAADQVNALQGVTNTFGSQVATLEQEKADLKKERDLLDQRSKTLLTEKTDLEKQIAALTNATTRTRTTSGGTPTHIIQTPGTGIGSAKSQFTTNGIAGGVPALFVNKAEQTVIMTVRGNGVTFTLDLKARTGVRRFDILPGEYAYNYTVGDDPTLLPEGGSATFTVDKDSSHYLEGYGAFNGGAIFRGKQ